MTPHHMPAQDPHSLLAGFADGELDPETARLVQAWIKAEPTTTEVLNAQRQLGPDADLFQSTEPNEPNDEAWVSSLDKIHARLAAVQKPTVTVEEPAVARRSPTTNKFPSLWSPKAGQVAGGLLAASVLLLVTVFGVQRQFFSSNNEPTPEFATAIPVSPPPRVVIPTAPLPRLAKRANPDEPIQLAFDEVFPNGFDLAGPDDVLVESMVSEEGSNMLPRLTNNPGDLPLIYANGP